MAGFRLEVPRAALLITDRVGLPIALDAPEQHGADFLPAFKPYFPDGRTLVASAHKAYGPERDDLAMRRRRAGVSQVVLAGMSANLCVESCLRALLESGFEVAVIEDATAALVNFRYIADALWSTDEALRQI